MTTTPPRGPRKRAPQRIRVPALTTTDLVTHQRNNIRGVRRRLRNAERKITEARMMLSDAPPEIDASVRNDLWQMIVLLDRLEKKLVMKRGRKPLVRPSGPQDAGPTISAV